MALCLGQLLVEPLGDLLSLLDPALARPPHQHGEAVFALIRSGPHLNLADPKFPD